MEHGHIVGRDAENATDDSQGNGQHKFSQNVEGFLPAQQTYLLLQKLFDNR